MKFKILYAFLTSIYKLLFNTTMFRPESLNFLIISNLFFDSFSDGDNEEYGETFKILIFDGAWEFNIDIKLAVISEVWINLLYSVLGELLLSS